MPKITKRRIGEYLQTALQIALEHDGAYPIKSIVAEMEKRMNFDDYEKQAYQKSGYIRWQSTMHFWSIDLKKAGWLRKDNGIWYVTEEGKKALELDPEVFISEANEKYWQWAKARELVKEKSIEEKTEAPAGAIYEQSQSSAREEIKEYIKGLNPYEFQDLVVALFRGMGYFTPFVAPRGPDGGIDVVAYKDPIGAEIPRIRIQVKHRPDTPVSGAEVQALSGALHREGYIGVIVSSGGFSSQAKHEIRNSAKHIEKIDLEEIIDLWKKHYEKLTDEDKGLLPLRRVSFLAPEE